MSQELSKPAQYRSTGAVVIASIAIGVAVIGCGPNFPGETKSVSTPGATATPSPPPSSLAAFTITIPEISPIQFTLSVPEGWTRQDWVVIKNQAHLGLFPVANVYADPCHWSGALLEPPVGPTVEDLAAALVNQPMRNATATDTALDGYPGTVVRMSVPADINFSSCDSELFSTWSEPGSDSPGRYAHGPGEVEDVYIINVEGTRVVMDVAHMPSTTAAELSELEEMVRSISIQP